MKTTLIAGSYERFVWGFNLKTQKWQGAKRGREAGEEEGVDHNGGEPSKPRSLVPLFSYPAHNSSVRSIAICGSVAVTGGSDDTIKIFDVATLSEVGSLINHTGVVTSLAFFSLNSSPSIPHNLFSGSDDGTINIYDTDPFVHLKTMNAHRKGVNDLSVHPSGQLALSVGHDSYMCMFNLVKGRRSFRCRLQKEAEIIQFAHSGENFFMITGETVSLHSSYDAKLVQSIDERNRVLCIAPSQDGLLFMGGEGRGLRGWDTTSGKIAYCVEGAHAGRLKGITLLGTKLDGDPSYFVASASSDGVVKVWDMRMVCKENSLPVAEAETKSRLTCLAGSSSIRG